MQLIIDIENFFDLPALVFLKDRLGKYHACNDYAAKQAGLTEGKELIGTTDFEYCWKAEAPFFQFTDKKVITEKQPLIFIENITTSDQRFLSALTYKIPARTLSKKDMVFGISFFINQDDSISELLHGMKIPYINTTKIIFTEKRVPNYLNRITPRQAEYLYYLVKGMTAKQIANEMGLSRRTIESYAVTLKQKLQCFSKSDLVKKAWELDIIKDKLFSDYSQT